MVRAHALVIYYRGFELLFRVGRSAAGAPEFKRYLQNPIYEIDLPSTTQLKYVPPSDHTLLHC